MINPHYHCEGCCKNHDPVTATEFIVITGGPGAGKTALLEYVRKLLCHHVVILPEAAGVLFAGGFWRLESVSAKKAAQRAIYHVQQEMQSLVTNEKKWMIGLCDRGTLDGLAYWPNSETTFFQNLLTNQETEYGKYKAIIHLRSPGLDSGYNWQNPIRTESAELAAQIDQKIHEAWKEHPHYRIIESHASFTEKINAATNCIREFLPDGVLINENSIL